MERAAFTRLVQLCAWTCVGLLAYLTLAHARLVYSIYFHLAPFLLSIGVKKYIFFEHFLSFALFGMLFAYAYPKRILVVCFIVFGSAIALEFMQTLTPDRHGRLSDLLQKLAGGACGILAAKIALGFHRKRQAAEDTNCGS